MSDQQPEVQLIELVADELSLARAQIDAGLPALAEGTLRRRMRRLEADGVPAHDEMDAARTLLAEALWRQGRLVAARASLDLVRPRSPQRRLPIALLVEAESLAAAGERDRAVGAMERLIADIGVEAAFELRAGVPGRLDWPLPADLRAPAPRAARAPWSTATAASGAPDAEPSEERTAAARSRMEQARLSYGAGLLEQGDAELSMALRLDQGVAADGVGILAPTLGAEPAMERLLLYGDLLRAAGRQAEAARAYERAAG